MCGVAGIARLDGLDPAPTAALLQSMLDRLQHRGPDDGSSVLEPQHAPWVAIGSRRLSLLDAAQGQQPRLSPCGRFWLSFNGEVYNHGPLRRELAADGAQLRGHGDVEIVLHLISRMGLEATLPRLHGMFAFALVDRVERRLVLVRDRVGKKPLYWAIRPDGALIWGSELRALTADPSLPQAHDRSALQQLLMFEYIPGPQTAVEGVQRLPPGSLLTLDARGLSQRRWWSWPLPEAGEAGDLGRWAKSLRGCLDVSVGQRLEADVPCAILLSGGLDSSAIAALATARRPGLHSFTVRVEGPGFDEADLARQTADTLGTHHHEITLQAADLEPTLGKIAAHMDEPLADSSLVGAWRLFEGLRAAGFRCALSGDGADELFGGYPTVFAHQLAPLLQPVAGALRRLTERLPVRYDGVSLDFQAKALASGLGLPWARQHQRWMGAWAPEELEAGPAVWAAVDAVAAEAPADRGARALYIDQRLYLPEGVLVKVDRASMAHGVEVRSPFLDHSVVQLAADIGLGHKVRGREGKRVLRAAMAGLLPEATLHRKKKGFGTPIGPWLRGPARGLLHRLPQRLADWIPQETLQRVIGEHERGQRDHRRRLWSALILAAYLERRP